VARVVLDSSVLIALISPNDIHHDAAIRATSAKHQYLISAVTLSESLVIPFRTSAKTAERIRTTIEKAVAAVVPINADIATLGAQARAISNLKMPDALISATATYEKSELWTFDKTLASTHKGARLIAHS
jgi:predicted nucleic acid-binding protein